MLFLKRNCLKNVIPGRDKPSGVFIRSRDKKKARFKNRTGNFSGKKLMVNYFYSMDGSENLFFLGFELRSESELPV